MLAGVERHLMIKQRRQPGEAVHTTGLKVLLAALSA